MALALTSGPALEPVTVSEAKAHLRLEGSAEDILIGSLIVTSRLHVEAALGLALITQGWRLTLDRWPEAGEVRFPLRPIQSITSIAVRAADGAPTEVPLAEDAEAYEIDILDGASVVRTIASGAPACAYTAAAQTADFGAPQGTLSVAVYQMSAAHGRGTPKLAVV